MLSVVHPRTSNASVLFIWNAPNRETLRSAKIAADILQVNSAENSALLLLSLPIRVTNREFQVISINVMITKATVHPINVAVTHHPVVTGHFFSRSAVTEIDVPNASKITWNKCNRHLITNSRRLDIVPNLTMGGVTTHNAAMDHPILASRTVINVDDGMPATEVTKVTPTTAVESNRGHSVIVIVQVSQSNLQQSIFRSAFKKSLLTKIIPTTVGATNTAESHSGQFSTREAIQPNIAPRTSVKENDLFIQILEHFQY